MAPHSAVASIPAHRGPAADQISRRHFFGMGVTIPSMSFMILSSNKAKLFQATGTEFLNFALLAHPKTGSRTGPSNR
jgi:hypothetical protein